MTKTSRNVIFVRLRPLISSRFSTGEHVYVYRYPFFSSTLETIATRRDTNTICTSLGFRTDTGCIDVVVVGYEKERKDNIHTLQHRNTGLNTKKRKIEKRASPHPGTQTPPGNRSKNFFVVLCDVKERTRLEPLQPRRARGKDGKEGVNTCPGT